jgi:hypothetical protein
MSHILTVLKCVRTRGHVHVCVCICVRAVSVRGGCECTYTHTPQLRGGVQYQHPARLLGTHLLCSDHHLARECTYH